MASTLVRDTVREVLAPILPRLYQYLEAGCAVAQEFFAAHQAVPDAALASHLVRWWFLQALRAEAAVLGVEAIEDLGLSGISFRYRGYHLRVWKDEGDDLTQLASSDPKKAFLSQQIHWDFAPNAVQDPAGNIVLLWNVDRDLHLHAVRFGPPQAMGERYVLAWAEPIAFPELHATPADGDGAVVLSFEPIGAESEAKREG